MRKFELMISRFLFLFVVFFTFSPTSIGQSKSNDTIVLGAGCFWCVEAVFQELKGVRSVESGYAGGHVSNPSYKAVCDGTTGHAEVARIVYNPAEISFEKLLSVFFLTHDPTTLNRQGADIGTQYRSAIFYTNIKQKEVSLRVISDLDRQGAYPKPIVTEVKPLQKFWPAENYHQDYYDNNPNQGYCKYVIQPKLEKFRKVFKDELK